MKAVYIVKQAVATGLGSSIEENWDRLIKGESAIAAVAPRHADRSGGRRAALIPDLVPFDGENRVCAVARMALDRIRPVAPETCIVWTGLKGNAEYIEGGGKKTMPFLPEHYRRWAAGLLDNRGPGLDISAACASSTVGLAIGAQKIARGEYGAVLVCAADVVTGFVAAGFSALKALTASVCRPFDSTRDGMCVGDGAVAILLADAKTAADCELKRLARVSGWGITNDANHITGPARDGSGLAAAIATAMGMAGTAPDDVQAFCAHGTGTVFNDGMELAAFETVYGNRLFPFFSIKGAIGHTLGAAGGIDAAISVHALAKKRVPPTVGLKTPETKATGRVSNRTQAFDGRTILTTNSGFGGINAALVLQSVDS
ncbi:MAG: beta-ketoacyl synthase N-terminal-like domain-containing protein [Desulfobacterales bacterium]|jgi:3-oxoacyl-[acyl-carrier-protein] synthase II